MSRRVVAVLGAVATVVMAGFVTWAAIGFYEQIEAFARTDVPGRVNVAVERQGNQMVYMEPARAVGLGAVDIAVSGPDGLPVSVRPNGFDVQYHVLQYDGRAIASFHAAQPGVYQVSASGSVGTLAIGGDLTGSIVALALGCVGLVGMVLIGLALGIAVWLQSRPLRARARWVPNA